MAGASANGSICSSPRIRRGRRRCTTWCAFTARPGENRSMSIQPMPSASSACPTPKPIACSPSSTGTCCSPTPSIGTSGRRATSCCGTTAAPCIRPPAAIPPMSGASIGARRSCSERDQRENGPWLADKPPIFLFGHPIGRAGHLLNAVAAEDRDLIAAGLDQLLLLKALQRLGDAGPAHAEHQRQKFVGERQRLVAGAVLGHQNPSRQTPVDLGPRVGDGRVG